MWHLIWSYLDDQMSRWQEVLFGFGLVFFGLWLEDWIDRFRNRERDERND